MPYLNRHFSFTEVGSGHSDLGFGGAFATWDRSQLATFLYPMHIEPFKFICPAPKPRLSWGAIFTTFDEATWTLALLATLIQLGLLTQIELMYFPKVCRYKVGKVSTSGNPDPAWLTHTDRAGVLPRWVVLRWCMFALLATLIHLSLLIEIEVV
jgi:hypothetical protein